MKYIEKFDSIVSGDKLCQKNAYRGCTEKEIAELEEIHSIYFPPDFREFLYHYGKRCFPLIEFRTLYGFIKKGISKELWIDIVETFEEDNLDINTFLKNKLLISYQEDLGSHYLTFLDTKNAYLPAIIYRISTDEYTINDRKIVFLDSIESNIISTLTYKRKAYVRYKNINVESQFRYMNLSEIRSLWLSLGEIEPDDIDFYTTKFNRLADLYLDEGFSDKGKYQSIDFHIPKQLKELSINLPRLKTLNFCIGKNVSCSLNIKNLFQPIRRRNPSLQKLNIIGQLSNIPLTVFDLRNLEVLNVRGNKISQISPHITNLTKLRQLNIAANPLSESEIKKVRSLLPNTNIIITI